MPPWRTAKAKPTKKGASQLGPGLLYQEPGAPKPGELEVTFVLGAYADYLSVNIGLVWVFGDYGSS